LAAVHRKQGLTKQSDQYYLEVSRLRSHDAWWACAAGERWLKDPQDIPPKEVMHAPSGPKPRLDGRLDDDIWQRARSAALHGNEGDEEEPTAYAKIAYDEEFLYIGVECRKVTGADYSSSDAPRPYDADLREHDRVDIFVDLDRDWSTFYRLSIDHRGWTGEACWGDKTWNPQWFVAAATDDDTWTVEAAIPLAELTGEVPKPKHVWAIGLQRTLPGVGFQSWTYRRALDI
jgi:hypothetical protein